jgi:DNA primase
VRPNQQLIELWTTAADTYADAYAGSPADEYMQSRGIDAETAREFGLGYVVEPAPGHDERYKGMLSIPYYTPNGVVGFKFRHIDGRDPKYLAPAGQKTHLFNVGAIIRSVHKIIIVEGELDAIAAEQIGYPAVGVGGVNSWKSYFPRCFDGIGKVIVCTDNDDKADGSNPGQELARKLADVLPQSIRVSLPHGHDVNSTIQTYGAEHFTKLVESV